MERLKACDAAQREEISKSQTKWMHGRKENNAQLGSEQSKTVSVILENDVGLVFSAHSKTSRWQVEEPFVPGQGEDGQKREPPFCDVSRCDWGLSGDSSSSDVWEAGLRKRSELHSLALPWACPCFSGRHRCHSLRPDQQEADVREGPL